MVKFTEIVPVQKIIGRSLPPLCSDANLRNNHMQYDFKLSPWVKFKDYKSLDDCRLPGIYVLARFDSPPSSPASVTAKEIVYIGETTGQDIAKRLYQFGRTAFGRFPAHSGGSKFSDEFLDKRVCEQPPDDLYVAIMGVSPAGAEKASVYIKFLERAAIWLFFQKYNALPRCNSI
ncbi:hypothetical protein PAQ31011_00205 [Pandoraea aquatica]|uniref:Uncharacterized protein n=1 Tax=Pandoraea aquatica TaxID=2508290 RepID=A0A5E4RIY3_9BURK|nr:hypothetical protein [Pandoraea aquatica]VVD63246.1 hypothetical protein PAQ31011_00205 [Pandoraea aquatica]